MLFSFSSKDDDALRIRQWLEQYEEVYLALVCHTALYREVALLDQYQLKEWVAFLEVENESLQVFVNKEKQLRVGSLYGEIAFMVDKDRLSHLHLPLPQSLPHPRRAAEKPKDKDPIMIQLNDEFCIDYSILPELEASMDSEVNDAIEQMNLKSENKLLRKELLLKSRQLESIQEVLRLLVND